MIAVNHPALGAALSVDPLAAPGWRTIGIPPYRVVSIPAPQPAPEPVQTPAAPPVAVNQISPPPGVETWHLTPGAPQPPAITDIPLAEEAAANAAAAAAASIPASASATGSATSADTSAPFSLSDWLSAETLFPGYPNGLVAAGGVIAIAWLFGGKKGRR
jgi:hypothetical protein